MKKLATACGHSSISVSRSGPPQQLEKNVVRESTDRNNKNGSSAIPTFRMQAKKESCHQTKGGKAQCQLKSAQTNAFLIITGGRDPNPAGNGSLTPSVSSSLRLQHTFVGVKKEVGGSETGQNRSKWLLSRACTSEWARPKSQKGNTISESKRSLLCEHVAYTGTIIYGVLQRTASNPASRSGALRTFPRLW